MRTTIEHNILLGNVPDVMEGIKKYGIILNAQPTLLPAIPKLIADYGEQLRKFAMPVKTWIDLPPTTLSPATTWARVPEVRACSAAGAEP